MPCRLPLRIVYSWSAAEAPRYPTGEVRVERPGALATPLKALADLVYTRRVDWRSAAPVVESLRVEEESLAALTGELFDEVMTAYEPGRVTRFLTGLRKDLTL